MKIKVGDTVRFTEHNKSWSDINIPLSIYNKCFKNKTLVIYDISVREDVDCPVFRTEDGRRYYTLPGHCLPLEIKSNKPTWF